MMRNEDYSIGAAEPCLWMDPLQDRKGKRRFNEDQIRSLESIFKSQTRLDPRKKQQLARELGLHPRQVAIWFQNKRARGKSKQLESEYGALKADYDALLSSVESLEKEKQILTTQLQMLTGLLEEPLERRKYGDSNKEAKEDHRLSLSMAETSDVSPPVHSVGNRKKTSNFSEQEPEPFMGQSASDFSTSVEQQFCFQPSLPSDQSYNSSQWWEFCPMGG